MNWVEVIFTVNLIKFTSLDYFHRLIMHKKNSEELAVIYY